MKLLNQSIKYLSVSILGIISLWATIFYFNLLDEIKESVDEGLENYKRQIIYKAQIDSTLLNEKPLDEGFFALQEIDQKAAFSARDRYKDTLLYMQDADDELLELEPVRMLTTVFEKSGKYYELTIINSKVEEDDLIEGLFWQIVWLYIILVTSIIIINNYVLKRLWKPFYSYLEQLKNYKLGRSKHLPAVKTKTTEFTDLQIAVNILLKHSLGSYEQQKQFIGNASHELQTPLAIATNKLELLVEEGNLANEQAESIAVVMTIIERMTRLNKSLLLLTKIENKQFFDNQSISLNKIAEQNVGYLAEMAEFKEVNIIIQETNNITVNMDVSLANIIISNLIKNAIIHTLPKGIITINMSENNFRISNTAENEALISEKIFSRFYKTDSQQISTGLGLSIVKAICDLYGFSILYEFKNKEHSFELRVNAA